jgi:DNA-binding NarL/FixJ family response regulator
MGVPFVKSSLLTTLPVAKHVAASSEGTTCDGSGSLRRRIFIVDDHEFYVRGLSTMINHEPDLEVCGSSDDADKMLAAVTTLHPDLVILDIHLRLANGFAMAKALREVCPETRFVFVSSAPSEESRKRAAALGARGILEKTMEPAEVLAGIRRALEA